ncbi:MAG: hypothetical protein AAFQ04_00265 [Pseudomonadota bacterium]
MNANQIINMVIRMVMRRALRGGVNAGIDAISKRKSKNQVADGQPAQAQGGPDSKETTKRMKQSMRMARKMGRF